MPTVSHRHFGSVRKLPSGRWQARYEHDDTYRTAPATFKTKADAQAWLSATETDLSRGAWIDPNAGHVTFAKYANSWLEHRPDLRPSTRAKYRRLLDQHLLPAFGQTAMAALRPSTVRGWWVQLSAQLPATTAGAYRLLATICNTAVADQVIVRSPCVIRGGGRERSPERPTASVAEVSAAIQAVPERYRLALLLAVWCQLRRGEVLGLQRRDIDEFHGELRIERAFIVHSDGTHAVGPPKSDAGRRIIAIPGNVLAMLTIHLAEHVEPRQDAWLFPGEAGLPVTPRTLNRAWERARVAAGRPDLHLHDLRHSGLTWTAATGATTAELMHRAGHASPAAALRYQHATKDRDRALADALAALSEGHVAHLDRAKKTG